MIGHVDSRENYCFLRLIVVNFLTYRGLFELITIFSPAISIVKLPTPVKIRSTEANEEAKVTEFQQELLQLAAVLKGENVFTSFPDKIGKGMNVRQGKEYVDDAVKRFFEAGEDGSTPSMSPPCTGPKESLSRNLQALSRLCWPGQWPLEVVHRGEK